MENAPASADRGPAMGADAFPPFTLIDGDPACGLLLICDHARNRVPPAYRDLGLPAEEFRRHIAYDPGAEALTVHLAAATGAPAVLAAFSRLLIDANRGEDDPTLVMRLSDGAVVPGNADIDAAERERRIRLYHAPYHAAIDAAVDRALATGVVPFLFSVHSFTPVWRGVPRPWHAGVLWDRDPRLAVPLIEALRADPALTVGDNEPYAGALRNDTMYRHATARGLAHALLEVRHDLIADGAGVAAWGARVTAILADLDRAPGIHEVRQYGSNAD